MLENKYEILLNYKDIGRSDLVRMTWANLGGLVSTVDTRTFVADMIYKLDVPGSELNGALIFCEEAYYQIDPPTWGGISVIDSDQGYITFGKGIISPYFRMLLSPSEMTALDGIVVDPTFIPYTEIQTSSIVIPQDELDIIMAEVGIPFAKYDELEISKAQIGDVILRPVFEEYFKRFPLIQPEQLQAQYAGTNGSRFEVPVPPEAFGATRVVILQGVQAGSKPGNPFHFFASEVMWAGGSPGSTYPGVRSGQGPRYANLQGFGANALDRAARQGIVNYATRIHFRIQRNKKGERKLIGHSNKIGLIEVHWAHMSNDWADIDFNRRGEVRKLATARVLRYLGMIRNQVKSNIPGAIDFATFISRAKELEDDVMNFWNSMTFPVIIRS